MSHIKKSKVKVVAAPLPPQPMNRQELLLVLNAALEACRGLSMPSAQTSFLVNWVDEQIEADNYPKWEMFEFAQRSSVAKFAAHPEVYGGAE